jgi:hypothetical protein
MKASIFLFAILAAASTASANLVYNLQDYGQCTGGCGTGILGTVTLTQSDANDVQIDVELAPNFFIQTGGPHEAFAFNAPAGITIGTLPTGFAIGASPTLDAGFGVFSYGISGPSPSKPTLNPQSLIFNVSKTNLSISDFGATSGGVYFFEADIYGASTGNTGEIAAKDCVSGSDCGGGSTQGITPEPFSFVLVGSGLALLGLRRLRR